MAKYANISSRYFSSNAIFICLLLFTACNIQTDMWNADTHNYNIWTTVLWTHKIEWEFSHLNVLLALEKHGCMGQARKKTEIGIDATHYYKERWNEVYMHMEISLLCNRKKNIILKQYIFLCLLHCLEREQSYKIVSEYLQLSAVGIMEHHVSHIHSRQNAYRICSVENLRQHKS